MQHVIIVAVCLLAFCTGARARQLTESTLVNGVMLMGRSGAAAGGRAACTATIALTGANGSPLPGATVSFKWAGGAAAKATTNSRGRLAVATIVPAGSTACSMQLLGVASADGAPLAFADASRVPRTIKWS